MSPDPRTQLGPTGVVVGIGDQGFDTVRTAVRLGAEEAALRHVSLRLVHGSRPIGQKIGAASSSMEVRQQRGRRLVNGAARELAATPLGRSIQIWTESSPQTGIDLLLAHSGTAAMLVLQRVDGLMSAGPTTSAVMVAARCPTLVTRPSDRTLGHLGVLVLLDPEQDPAPAIALAFTEASLRGSAVTVLDGRNDPDAVRTAFRVARANHPDVLISCTAVSVARPAERIRENSENATLIVVVRPARDQSGLAAAAIDEAACPVLAVGPVHAGV